MTELWMAGGMSLEGVLGQAYVGIGVVALGFMLFEALYLLAFALWLSCERQDHHLR